VTPNDDARMDDLLRQFVEQPVSSLASKDAQALRARVAPGIEGQRTAIARGHALRARWLGALGATAAAAGVALAVWVGASHVLVARAPENLHTSVVGVEGDTRVVGVTGAHEVDTEAVAVGPDDELTTGPGSAARATLPTGAVVEVGPATRLRFLQTGEPRALRDRIELASGRIDVRVPRLPSGSDLRVLAQDVTVVVHGTRFSVEELAGDPGSGRPRVRVAVTEGRVAVYEGGEEHLLGAGDAWTADDRGSRGDAGAAGPERAEGSSTLAIENGLLSEAMTLRRAHRPERSLALLDELLGRYPGSPLAETASVERLNALQDLGASRRLSREAEQYLARYPQGFARVEVSRMLAHAEARHP
jgi:hypothetical protein